MNADARVPVWELHIRPLFRPIDHEHMAWLDLWDFETVRDRHESILGRLREGGMPPFDVGGPWPPEWVDLFARWTETGFSRLRLLAPSAQGYQLQQSSRWELVAHVPVPGDGWRVWLEIDAVRPEEREYTLYGEPGDEDGPASEVRVRDRFQRGTARRVIVHDADGTHDIPFPE